MKLLKALVIGMGVLIVAGFALLIYGVATQLGKTEGETADITATPEPPSRAARFGDTVIGLAPGERFAGVQSGAGQIVITTTDAAGRTILRVIDPASGEERGRILLEPAPR